VDPPCNRKLVWPAHRRRPTLLFTFGLCFASVILSKVSARNRPLNSIMRRSSAKRPPKTSTKLSVSGVLLVCPLVLFGVVFILALVVQFLNSRSDQFITQFRASLSRSRTAEAYHRLGITCEPNDCDNERISCNSSRLMAEELESAVPLIDLISRMRRDNQFLSTNSVRILYIVFEIHCRYDSPSSAMPCSSTLLQTTAKAFQPNYMNCSNSPTRPPFRAPGHVPPGHPLFRTWEPATARCGAF